jgi:lipid biosynthesis B12-binding/radical SAM protein
MKILLIASNIATSPYPVYPLGLSMVAAALKSVGHEVHQLDFLTHEKSLTKIQDEVISLAPDLIGISIRNIDNVNLMNEQRYIDTVKDIIQVIKEKTKVPVVLGGPGFSIMPERILKQVGADYGVVGEGEAVMIEFVNNFVSGILPPSPLIHAGHKLTGREITAAAYDPRILQFYLQSGNMVNIQTKRGCSHSCVYCSYPILEGHQIRPRDPHEVVYDIQRLIKDHDAKYLFFTDSVFNDDDGYYLEVIEEMRSRSINIPWTAFFKPDKSLNEDIINLMKTTGLKAAEIGADASTNTTLRAIGKNFTFEDVVASNELFINSGVATAHSYMFGCPDETKETVLEGIENIRAMKNTVSFMFMGIRILPDTPLYIRALAEGVITKDQDLLNPVYYIAPGLDHQWLEVTLTEGFKGLRNCIFPPDKFDSSLQFMHKLGHTGSLWDMLLENSNRRNRRKDDPK